MKNLDRRRFLLGPGGAAMALPFLPSLFSPSEALAQARSFRCFVNYATGHGGVRNRDMFPSVTTPAATMNYGGFTIRQTPLVAAQVNGETRISECLRAPSAQLPSSLVAKLNVINGLDVPMYLGHTAGFHLGNFSASDQATPAIKAAHQRQTIDQILGWSPTFYGDASRVTERVLVSGGMSWAHLDPIRRTGAVERVADTSISNTGMFDRLFGAPGSAASTSEQGLLIDRVLADYQSLRTGSTRLAAADRIRLDEHAQRMFELQRKLRAIASQQSPTRPTTDSFNLYVSNPAFERTPTLQTQYYQLFNDVIVAAFSTGASRIASVMMGAHFTDYSGDWHQGVAHQHETTQSAYDLLLTGNRAFFRTVFLDLVRKMDAASTGDGRTLLDHSLAVWTQEAGNYTHDQLCVPVVAFGSAGGFLRTGQYCDYRDVAKFEPRRDNLISEGQWHGLLWHQWLGTVVQSMGLPRSEYESSGVGGYPNVRYNDQGYSRWYPDSVWNVTGDLLPWLRA